MWLFFCIRMLVAMVVSDIRLLSFLDQVRRGLRFNEGGEMRREMQSIHSSRAGKFITKRFKLTCKLECLSVSYLIISWQWNFVLALKVSSPSKSCVTSSGPYPIPREEAPQPHLEASRYCGATELPFRHYRKTGFAH